MKAAFLFAVLFAACVGGPCPAAPRGEAATPAAQKTTATQPAAEYTLARTMKLQDDGRGWNSGMTIDQEGKFLYLLGTGQTLVIDAATGKQVAAIRSSWAFGIVLVPELGRGFISTGQEGVVIFDLKTSTVLGHVPLREGGGAITYDPESKRVLVVTHSTNLLIPFAADVDPKKPQTDEPIKLQGEPESLVADGQGMVYVTVRKSDDAPDHIAVIDTRIMKQVTAWHVRPAIFQPTGMCIDRRHNRLFVACTNHILVLSATDGHELAAEIAGNVGLGWYGHGVTAFYPPTGEAFGSCGDGSLTVIGQQPDGAFEVRQNLPEITGIRAMAVNPKTGAIYLPVRDLKKNGEPVPDTFRILVLERK